MWKWLVNLSFNYPTTALYLLQLLQHQEYQCQSLLGLVLYLVDWWLEAPHMLHWHVFCLAVGSFQIFVQSCKDLTVQNLKERKNWGNNDKNLHSPETFWSCPPSFSTGFLWCSYQDHLLFEPCIYQQIIVNEFIVDSCSTWRYGSRSPDTQTSSADPGAQSWRIQPSSNPLQTTAPLWTHSHQLNNNRLRILF